MCAEWCITIQLWLYWLIVTCRIQVRARVAVLCSCGHNVPLATVNPLGRMEWVTSHTHHFGIPSPHPALPTLWHAYTRSNGNTRTHTHTLQSGVVLLKLSTEHYRTILSRELMLAIGFGWFARVGRFPQGVGEHESFQLCLHTTSWFGWYFGL